MAEQLALALDATTPTGKTIGDAINDIYATRTDADFEHMRRMLAGLPTDQPAPRGAHMAELLLALRAMELAEHQVLYGAA